MSSYKKEKNYYDILEVSKEATIDEIRKSYKKLALKWHPVTFINKRTKTPKTKKKLR